jgi:hypothetical protein
MDNTEKLETLGTQDTERRQTKTNKHNTKYQNDENIKSLRSRVLFPLKHIC